MFYGTTHSTLGVLAAAAERSVNFDYSTKKLTTVAPEKSLMELGLREKAAG